MGLWQNLCEAYTANEELLRKLYPLSTTTVNNASKPLLVVSISGDGDFRSVRVISKKAKGEALQSFVIPVTEASMGRTGTEPHPLFDNYAYLKGEGEKFNRYLEELGKRQDLTREFKAVYRYVSKRTLSEDAKQFEPKDDTFVLFEVEFQGEVASRLWEDEGLMRNWHEYYMRTQEEAALKDEERATELCDVECELERLENEKSSCDDKTKRMETQEKIKTLKQQLRELKNSVRALKDSPFFCFDMIMGNHVVCAISHPKKIANAAGNAKLISDNDKENFTYRGRFATSREAFSVGYDSSQRAHQFLRYVVNDHGIKCDSQVIVAFTAAKKAEEKPLPPLPVADVQWGNLNDDEQLSSDTGAVLSARTGVNFAHALSKALAGYREDPVLRSGLHDPTMIVILDAATTGRLSITFYREMTREDYLEKLQMWHQSCQWLFSHKGADGMESKYTGAPSIDNIIAVVYGCPRGSDSGYNKFRKQAREILMRCIFDNSPIPDNYLIQAIRRASSPLANAVDNGKFNRGVFLRNVSVACALFNKSLKDKGKDQYDMSIELNRKDRDYLYGRLLGAADKLEEYALYKKRNERKETAAIRYMQTFSQKPYSTWNTIHQTLVPYIQQVKNSIAYEEIQQIHGEFQEGDFENDAPLSGAYLLGYYCERMWIEQLISNIKKENTEETNNEHTNDEQG